VYTEFDRLLGGGLTVIFSTKHTPDRVRSKIEAELGPRAVALDGERVLFHKGDNRCDFANAYAEVTYQPGLYKQIRECRPDVVIAEGFFRWSPAVVAYSIMHRIPFVISYERTHHTERNSQWIRTVYRKMVTRLADAICCNGRLSAEYSHWLGMPMERIVTGGMAADSIVLQRQREVITDEERNVFKEQLNLFSPVFLYVGQLVERKGVRQFLDGWTLVYRRREGIKGSLLIVGEGPERQTLQDFVRNNGLANVHFVGGVDYDRIADYYASAEVFVIPTLEDNWSLVVPEAMACGLPILCSVYNGCWPELVHDKVNGWFFRVCSG